MACSTFLCGWIADPIMGSAGFTVFGNWLLSFAGPTLGFYLQNYFGYWFKWYPEITLAVFFISGFEMLMVTMALKRVASA
jgi:uncharacterized membrane protein YeaQ/YmgE (transglycosylase-associated protein family)